MSSLGDLLLVDALVKLGTARTAFGGLVRLAASSLAGACSCSPSPFLVLSPPADASRCAPSRRNLNDLQIFTQPSTLHSSDSYSRRCIRARCQPRSRRLSLPSQSSTFFPCHCRRLCEYLHTNLACRHHTLGSQSPLYTTSDNSTTTAALPLASQSSAHSTLLRLL